MPATIRWLKRPRPTKYHYACDKCSATYRSYVAPDLSAVMHLCNYKTAGGTWRKVERKMILQ